MSRPYVRERGLEIKRAKGEASCAECRRLKLKCDRKTPCTSCVRRGCQTICPNGALSSGQGTRFVLANTDRLHEKLLQMSQRIRQLEDALQIAQSSITPASHPLLSEELLAIKSCVDIMFEREVDGDDTHELASGLSSEPGTLSISERGETCFMGQGSSEAMLMVLNESFVEQTAQEKFLSDNFRDLRAVPHQILSISKAFPFAPAYLPKAEIVKVIEALLPSYSRATALAEAYLSNIAWSFVLVNREQLFEELLPSVYKRTRSPIGRFDDGDDEYDSGYMHSLALLLSVFGSGAAGDFTLPIDNDEAELYIHLARAAVGLNSVFAGALMEDVQTILMLAAYDFFASIKSSLEPSWKMLSFGLTLASSIGLHRDPARWNMEPKIVQRRRRLFWELFTADKWKSLESGRPATFNLREVDCEFPEDKEASLDDDGSILHSYWYWKYRFVKEVLAPVAEQLCLARPIKYSEVLELDRKCREFEAHPYMSIPTSPEPDESFTTALRRYHLAEFREVVLLFVHRSFFARAMLENPTKPLGSPFASSLLSAYASAITLLKILRIDFEKYPDALLRQWMIWSHGIASAVIAGSVACRGPASFVAVPALKELEAAVELFKKARAHPVPRRALPFLECFLEKARSANRPIPKDTGNARQELSILGGTAPIFLNKAIRKPSTSSDESSSRARRSAILPRGGQFSHSDSPAGMVQGEQFSANRHGTSVTAPQPSRHTPPWQFSQQQQVFQATAHIPFPENLEQAWNAHKPTLSSDVPSSFSGPPMTCESPFTNQIRHNMPELSSTLWLEELSNNMSGCFDRGCENVNSENLDFLMGGNTESISIPVGNSGSVQEGDPVIEEAWRSLMTESQMLGL